MAKTEGVYVTYICPNRWCGETVELLVTGVTSAGAWSTAGPVSGGVQLDATSLDVDRDDLRLAYGSGP